MNWIHVNLMYTLQIMTVFYRAKILKCLYVRYFQHFANDVIEFCQSLNHLLAIPGEDNEAINMAIDCVGQAGETKLIEELVRFLMGDKDGIPKVVPAQRIPLT